MGVFLAYISPRGRALVDGRLYLPHEWTDDPVRCAAAGVPSEEQEFKPKWQIGLDLLKRAVKLNHLQAPWVVADDAYGEVPGFRDGVEALGLHYAAEVPGNTPVWPIDTAWETPPYCGRGTRPNPRPVAGQRREVRERAAALAESGWTAVTVGEGAQGPRTYLFACERVMDSRDNEPGKEVWLIHRKNLDGTQPRYYFSNAPVDTPLDVLACKAAARWPIETEFETEKDDVGLDEYEVRHWAGWHHHVVHCMLASAFLLHMQQEWGGKGVPDHASAGVSRHSRTLAAQGLDTRGTQAMVGVDPGTQRVCQACPYKAPRSSRLWN
jgi:SRSO17 transposase